MAIGALITVTTRDRTHPSGHPIYEGANRRLDMYRQSNYVHTHSDSYDYLPGADGYDHTKCIWVTLYGPLGQ